MDSPSLKVLALEHIQIQINQFREVQQPVLFKWSNYTARPGSSSLNG